MATKPIYGDSNPSIPCGYSAPPEQPKRGFNWPVLAGLALFLAPWIIAALIGWLMSVKVS